MARPPKEFHDFIGQRRVVRTLGELADEATRRGGVLRPLMLAGPAGYGKTALTEALARHLSLNRSAPEAVQFRSIHAGPRCIFAIRDALEAARPGDLVFIDEAHALTHEDAELIYLAVDQGETLALGSDGRLDRGSHIEVAPVTLVLATNLPGKVPKALRSRVITIELEPYTPRELRAIACRVALTEAISLTPQAARVIAEHCDGTPRSVEQLVSLVASLRPSGRVGKPQVREIIKRALGHDEHGLTPSQQRAVRLLAVAGGSVRAEQMVSTLGFDPVYVRTEIEDPLIRRGLLFVRQDRRRVLTEKGRAFAAECLGNA